MKNLVFLMVIVLLLIIGCTEDRKLNKDDIDLFGICPQLKNIKQIDLLPSPTIYNGIHISKEAISYVVGYKHRGKFSFTFYPLSKTFYSAGNPYERLGDRFIEINVSKDQEGYEEKLNFFIKMLEAEYNNSFVIRSGKLDKIKKVVDCVKANS